MKIAIVGVGAMGSVYAGLLGDAGNELWAVDLWREHVDAINKKGLRVEGASGDRVVRLHATTDATDVGEAELVVIATKAMDVEAAAEAARPLVGPETLVVSIQNGLGGPASAAECSATSGSQSASPAASAPRSSSRVMRTTTGSS